MFLKRINNNTIWFIVVSMMLIMFILLIIITFGQLYYNKNLDERYDKLVFNQKKDMMEKYNTTIEELEKQLEELKNQNSRLQADFKKEKEKSGFVISMYEAIIKADRLRQEGNVIDAADEMRALTNKDYLLPNGKKLAEKIENETYKRAAISFYNSGIEKYENRQYPEAILEFKKSIFCQTDEYFNEKTLYLLTSSYCNIKDIYNANLILDKLVEKYPESPYIIVLNEKINSR